MDQNLNGLKISLCQMPVVPGRPDLNAEYIINEIHEASKRNVDIIAFPEMCVTGYLVGDIFEDNAFINDVTRWNVKIISAVPKGITIVFGTTIQGLENGEDGRQRLHNGAIAATDGKIISWTIKTLQPDYRFFNDDKHFYSMRKVVEGSGRSLEDILHPFVITVRGKTIRIGVILCEDMWHKDYAFNPTKILVENGAQIIFNLSASPWTWKKNDKRHRVVKELLTECKVPFVYVNNTDAQNDVDNIMVFDGSSTFYDENGDIIFEVPPYAEGGHDFTLTSNARPVPARQGNDTEELYAAMKCATRSIVRPEWKIVVGLSGGVDSAVVLAHFVDLFGSERMIAVNMPFGNLNSQKTQDFARSIAKNLAVEDYRIIPIDNIVTANCEASGVKPGTPAYPNVQARARMMVLAGIAQEAGGVFTCNTNKVEAAFGYGTVYGDIAGFYAPLGDLLKREIRQIADYLNKVVFRYEVIPEKCIVQPPSAELEDKQHDPFDYGYIDRRGYHDEMVRAYMEFRKNPEWFLEMYIEKHLEGELILEVGTLARIFKTNEEFVEDLEKWRKAFFWSVFKRGRTSPPIPIFSRRAFGRDFEESMMSPHFTEKYKKLKEQILG